MAETVLMPKLGFDMAEGTLVRWVKAEGETVNKGEVLAEIETDKATVEVESSFSGIVFKHLVEQGTVVPVGGPIATITSPGEKVDESGKKPQVEPAVTAETAAPSSTKPIGTAEVGQKTTQPAAMEAGMVKASPLAKRVAAESGVDIHNVRGSGPGGRVVRSDVEAFLASKPEAAAAVAAPSEIKAVELTPLTGLLKPLPVSSEGLVDQHVPVDRLRAAIGRRMQESKQLMPHFYVTHEVDMAPVMKLRSELNALLPDDQKLSVNDFIVKATALALRQFPNLNASLVGKEVVRHGHIHVGVAVAMNNGLLTVVCRDTDLKGLRQLSQEVKDMVNRARQGKVRQDDIEGSTFSISNLGMYDVEHFIAIINPPEAAILAIGSARQVPVVVDGEVRAGTRMKVTLSADHRVSDGAEAAQFLQALAAFLEQPLKLLL
jgi:pyruvate dehydrogenase E2 component (dihydrolipoamide acetyltransferase)